MTWQELVRDQIEKMEKEKIKETKRLDKIREDDNLNMFYKFSELDKSNSNAD